jgi:hypothetical protein
MNMEVKMCSPHRAANTIVDASFTIESNAMTIPNQRNRRVASGVRGVARSYTHSAWLYDMASFQIPPPEMHATTKRGRAKAKQKREQNAIVGGKKHKNKHEQN